MEKLAAFIVDKRNLIFLLYVFALIFSIVAMSWVNVENDITTYLGEDTETRQGLTVMNDNFTTFGTARVMISNITYAKAEALVDQIEAVDGVDSVEFDDTTDHYKDASALYTVTFDGEEMDDISIHALHQVEDLLSGYDLYVDTAVGVDNSADLASEMGLILAIAAVIIVLVLTLTSRSYAEVPVLLIVVIQGSIWLNFSFPYLQDSPLYFLGYLVVNSIQMGANIDYAIVISSHYLDLKKYMKPRDAIITALNEAFPTIFTSGTILAVAGSLIGVMTTNPVIASIGTCLGRGTIISIVLVLGVLPQILLLGDTLMERTSFEMKTLKLPTRTASGTMRVDGHVRGYISGVVDADFSGVLHGQMNAAISTGTTVESTQANADYYLDDVTSADDPPTDGKPDASDENDKGGEQQ